jgi:hypothetical protein
VINLGIGGFGSFEHAEKGIFTITKAVTTKLWSQPGAE